ncbi:MAG: HAMP domain-containing protein [Chloroflexi bacterium]|jgi:two-component system OmpR family sensor kinase|nr:ATP-binding protein [Anaerolineaceae bacterium]NMB89917.1 HAMP domain-containing protein [Chloroflexota bacterium]
MSLRLRLTWLYTSLLGGVLLIFGSLVYGLVSVVLLDQVDDGLTQTATELIGRIRVNSSNQFDPGSFIDFEPTENIIFQVWGNQRELLYAYPVGLQMALDDVGRWAGRPIFHTSQVNGVNLRVLSIPLKTSRGPVGILQVAINQTIVNLTQRTLASVLILIAILAMFVSGLAAWLVTGRALSPLATMTQVATQITRADDLQRRIPQTGPADDEVGQLVRAFNQTLERLERLFNTQRRFMADVSHELRTPLTVIKGNVGLMRRLGEADEESLSGIEKEVDRLTRLVGDLLLLAQAESGRVPLDKSPVELDTVLLEVFQQVRMLDSGRLSLRVTEIDQIQTLGDRDRLKQVLLNLASNAVQYTPSGGQVTLSLRRVGSQAQIIVSDTGPGIAPEDLPHIFERFYRGEKSRRRSQGSGFGLGLSIAHWIVRAHGGTIEVTSQLGKGTTFCVWLPVLEPQKTGPLAGPPALEKKP